MTYAHTAKHVYYNVERDTYHSSKQEGTICFDSISELKVYKMLLKYIPVEHISVHHKLQLANLTWNIDFMLTGSIVDAISLIPFARSWGTDFSEAVYIEYKGVITNDTYHKMEQYVKLRTRPLIIVCSDKSSNLEFNRLYDTYPVISTKFLEKILSVLQ